MVATKATFRGSKYQWLRDVEGSPWTKVRNALQAWFDKCPPDAQIDIQGRFRSQDNRNFSAVVWELLLHETLTRLDFDVVVHPPLQDTSATPDFLARRQESECIVEAVVSASSDEDVASTARLNQVYESINRVDSPNFWLELTILEPGRSSPSLAKHRRPIEKWLASLDPDAIQGELENLGEVSASYEIDELGFRLVIQPIPKAPEDRGVPNLRPLGSSMAGEAGLIDDITSIRSTLTKKAKKYGPLGRPYIIAQQIDRPFADQRDIRSALYGPSAVQYSVGREKGGPAKWVRIGDGFFEDQGGYANKNVSGVLVAFHVEPWRLGESDLKLWVHPGASKQPPELPFATVSLSPDGKQLSTLKASQSLLEVLGLEEGWPGLRG